MKVKRLPKSLKRHIRRQKARIRRETLDTKDAREQIGELYKKFFPEQNPTVPDEKATEPKVKQEKKPTKSKATPAKKGVTKKGTKKPAAKKK